MIRFESDYSEGAHPRVLELLAETNWEQTPGYGEDGHCSQAKKYIRDLCLSERADIHFLVGGTQANMTVISSILRPHQGVISACSGHINVHESGAIEATGHKVLTVDSPDGKIMASQVRQVYRDHWKDAAHEHMVQPGMVYISNPTEFGTIYTKGELKELSDACRECSLPLYLDGARLGYGLIADGNDVSLADLADYCDVFYIGGTKVGALFGEAVVITADALKKDFRYQIKQRGGLLAKGRLLGLQFEALFEDGLYFRIAARAVGQALEIRKAFEDKGFPLFYDSRTNQQFPILTNEALEKLSARYSFQHWQDLDAGHTAVRFCTSWATTPELVKELVADIQKL